MGRNISNAAIDGLATLLAEYLQGSKISSSQSVLHIRTDNSDKMMGLIEAAKEEISSALWDYNVLVEYPVAVASVQFIMHGNSFVCEQLAKHYGGRISNCKYWILYNEPLDDFNHGYKEKLPTVEEIVGYIEKMSQ